MLYNLICVEFDMHTQILLVFTMILCLQDHIFYSPRTLKLLARWTALEAVGRKVLLRKKGDEKLWFFAE